MVWLFVLRYLFWGSSLSLSQAFDFELRRIQNTDGGGEGGTVSFKCMNDVETRPHIGYGYDIKSSLFVSSYDCISRMLVSAHYRN
jgi:hypothetical protein